MPGALLQNNATCLNENSVFNMKMYFATFFQFSTFFLNIKSLFLSFLIGYFYRLPFPTVHSPSLQNPIDLNIYLVFKQSKTKQTFTEVGQWLWLSWKRSAVRIKSSANFILPVNCFGKTKIKRGRKRPQNFDGRMEAIS